MKPDVQAQALALVAAARIEHRAGPVGHVRQLLETVPPGRLLALVEALAALVPEDVSPDKLLAWQRADPDSLPELRRLHALHTQYRYRCIPIEGIPGYVRRGELAYQAHMTQQRKAARARTVRPI